MRRRDPAEVVLVADGREIVVGTVPDGACDIGLVDALARLRLGALGLGHRLYVRSPSEELLGLLELAGLRDVLTRCVASPMSSAEPARLPLTRDANVEGS